MSEDKKNNLEEENLKENNAGHQGLSLGAILNESMQEDEGRSTFFSVKDKTQAHAGICIVRDDKSSSAFVRVNQCVYLPLT
ncbi:MAG: hypothetical protein J5706_08720, partial [Elusimicrobiales bacterium]|nr:hypothetical protein [Elusimicrobiales bacterium]